WCHSPDVIAAAQVMRPELPTFTLPQREALTPLVRQLRRQVIATGERATSSDLLRCLPGVLELYELLHVTCPKRFTESNIRDGSATIERVVVGEDRKYRDAADRGIADFNELVWLTSP